jgi:hypothetical protein
MGTEKTYSMTTSLPIDIQAHASCSTMVFWYSDTVSDHRRSNSSRSEESSRTSVRESIAKVVPTRSDVESELLQSSRASASCSEVFFSFLVSDSEADTSVHDSDHEKYLSATARSSVSIQPEYSLRFELSVPSRTHAYRADQISRNRHCVSDMFRVVLSLHIDPLIEELSLSIYACVFGLRWGCLKSPGRLR